MKIFKGIKARKQNANVSLGQDMAKIFLENNMPDTIKEKLTEEGIPTNNLYEYFLIKGALRYCYEII